MRNRTMRNRTMRRKLQKKQRSRRLSRTRSRRLRQRGGDLPVPDGSLVAVSTGGEYGVPILMSKESFEEQKGKGGLEE